MTVAYDLLIIAGQDLTNATFRWKINDAPVDLTSFKARAHIRRALDVEEDPTVIFTTENGGIVLGGVTGTIEMLMDAVASAALWSDDLPASPTSYKGRRCYDLGYWDIEILNAINEPIERLLQGRVAICPEATR